MESTDTPVEVLLAQITVNVICMCKIHLHMCTLSTDVCNILRHKLIWFAITRTPFPLRLAVQTVAGII